MVTAANDYMKVDGTYGTYGGDESLDAWVKGIWHWNIILVPAKACAVDFWAVIPAQDVKIQGGTAMLLRRRKYESRRGFTLVELVVVLVILAILASVAVPAFSASWRPDGREKQSPRRRPA